MLVRPARLDENLRFAVLPREPVDVAFGYPHDGGDFSAAVRRCVGVAKCRTTEVRVRASGVMCPSFRATGEEEHSTRGRARLLHEMLAGEVVTRRLALARRSGTPSTCACPARAAARDCPVGVDMATYKAEFLHHHYGAGCAPPPTTRWAGCRCGCALVAPRTRGAPRQRPRRGHARWRRSRSGWAGIAPERELPRLAREPFSRWCAGDGAAGRRRTDEARGAAGR